MCAIMLFGLWAFKRQRDDWERAEIQAAGKLNTHAYDTT